MIDDLSPDERAALEAAREHLAPDPATIARLRARVNVAVGGGIAGAAAVKVTLSLVTIAAAAVGAIAYARRAQAPVSVPPPPASVTEVAVEQPEVSIHVVGSAADEPPPPPVELPRTEVPAAAATPTLAREIELIDRAMQALRRGDTPTVLATLDTYTSEVGGRGQLEEDAEAIEVEARCRAHDASASDRLEVFDQRWPRSAQRARITAACAAKP